MKKAHDKKPNLKGFDVLTMMTILLLIVISLRGILSLDFSNSFDVTNQYGEIIKIYGSGIYARDSFFLAPILIGSDFTIFFVVVPLFLYTYYRNRKESTNKTRLQLMSIYAIAFYYAASISLGVTYNQFHLLYIALFTCTLFGTFSVLRTIESKKLHYTLTKGMTAFLILAGISLIVAWLPDIIPTIIPNTPLSLIEVYTTNVTYVLDMGIIGPLCIVCLYLLKRNDPLGIVILGALLTACIIVGIMMIPQTICQILSGYEINMPALITKSLSFVLLGGFALYFNRKLYRNLTINELK